jgi:hypothetical protein
MINLQEPCKIANSLPDLVLAMPPCGEWRSYVFSRVHMRKECKVLECHSEAAIFRLDTCHVLPIEENAAFVRVNHAGNQAKKNSLARTGWTKKNHGFAGCDVKGNIIEDFMALEGFMDVFQ